MIGSCNDVVENGVAGNDVAGNNDAGNNVAGTDAENEDIGAAIEGANASFRLNDVDWGCC